jgi:hypothetical protein
MNSQTQLNLDLQPQTDAAKTAIEARATLYRIQINNLRREVDILEEKIAHHQRQIQYLGYMK